MASRLFSTPLLLSNSLRTPLLCGTVCAATLFTQQAYSARHAIRLDSSPSSTGPKDWSFTQYQNDARTPIVNKSGGLNARAVRQMSAGSVIGTMHPHSL